MVSVKSDTNAPADNNYILVAAGCVGALVRWRSTRVALNCVVLGDELDIESAAMSV